MKDNYDFCGWATKNDLKCSDGRVIRRDAFKDNDGSIVPLVWNHQHNDAANVLGHAELQNRPEGVYAYCTFNETEGGNTAKELVKHGDITSLSIYANQLKQNGCDVVHGAIREVSLVLAGANKGATIESFFEHSEDEDDEAIISTGSDAADLSFYHAEETKETNKEEENMPANNAGDNRTVKDVFDTMNEEQKNVCYAMIAMAMNGEGENEEMAQSEEVEEDNSMKHNVFQNEETKENTLSHAEMAEIIGDAKRCGSMKESFLAHGIDNIEYLFPDAQSITKTPEWYKRETGWVSGVMNGVHKTPFSRVKSMYADITADAARARGYIKGNFKVEETLVALKRTTTPCTIYKKQKLDRDDVIDITDFDVVAWLKSEMRIMLDEEIARAILVGDGRTASSDDKISEEHIRPIWTDVDTYTIKSVMEFANNTTDDDKAKAIIKQAVKSRKDYKGSGNTIFYTSEDYLTMMLLLEDTTGRRIYDTEEKLATAMRVKKIVTVPVLENLTRTVGAATHNLVGLIVDLNDYNIGADKGGAVNMFDDFDIDYNAQKYLIETRCSGALIRPKSAIALEWKVAA